MASKTVIRERLAFWNEEYKKLQKAYVALIEGGVKEYEIDDRKLTRFDLPVLHDEMEKAEKKIDKLETLLQGKHPRKAFGIMPMDW